MIVATPLAAIMDEWHVGEAVTAEGREHHLRDRKNICLYITLVLILTLYFATSNAVLNYDICITQIVNTIKNLRRLKIIL